MPAPVRLRTDFSATALRRLASKGKDANQSRRLLSLAAVLDGKSRAEAATIGGMDRQALRDWVHRFNAAGPDGLKDNWAGGVAPRMSAEQRAELAQIVEAGPDREKDGVVRWRRVDLQRVIAERFGVDYCERYVGTLLKTLGFSHISARPQQPGQDAGIVEAFKKLLAHAGRPSSQSAKGNAGRYMIPEPALGLDPRDEARIGQKNGLVRQWAKRGTRPRQPADQRYENAYFFGAICPARGKGAALVLPFADTSAMQRRLDEISRHVAEGAHAVLILDRAG